MESRSGHHQREPFWPGSVVRRWLKNRNKASDYSADIDEGDGDDLNSDSDSETEEFCQWPRDSRVKDGREAETQVDPNDALRRTRRRKSETFRAQYINTKEIRICVGTWNIGGKVPPDDLDIVNWLDINNSADMYVIGFQEIIPLNAGNIFGAEDTRPVPKWENIIRETLNRIQPTKTKFKCYSDPPSPSRFKPSDDVPDIEDDLLLESDSGDEEEIYPINEESNGFDEVRDELVNPETSIKMEFKRQFSSHSPKKLERLNCLRTEEGEEDNQESVFEQNKKLRKTISGKERIGLSWPEPPLDILGQRVLDRPTSFRSVKSFNASKSFRTYSSFKMSMNNEDTIQSQLASLAELDLESLINRRRRPQYVKLVSKQMVGIFVTIWVRRSLRRRIQNLNVSTVGVGVMGFVGNKGSVSVSMSIHQTLFCFICTHLTSGEKDADAIKRNADVHEIHRRTHFKSLSSIGLPRSIHDHERIIWLGDLNYRINLSYERTQELISKRDWSKLVESDQLIRELKKGCAFDGWSEGALNFAPTYKYEINSEKYRGEDPRAGRRTPAWCDRILSFGRGMRLLSYRRTEHKLSDHRPVTATYMVEVEVFSARKLQKALTITDAEIEDEELQDLGIEG